MKICTIQNCGNGGNMTDKEMCEGVARFWVEHDGDANGFLYCQRRILEAIKDEEEAKKRPELLREET